MKKRISVLVAIVLIVIMSVSTALADYSCPNSDFFAGGRLFLVTTKITSNKKDAYAKTSGGTYTYDTVNATYYWLNMITDDVGHYSETKSAAIEIKSTATSLTGTNKIYYKIISNHSGSYEGASGSASNVLTLIN